MKLETERLFLKSIDESYVDDILKIRSNDVINKYIKRNKPKNNFDALDFILMVKEKTVLQKIVFWGISFKNRRELIGSICLWNFSEDKKVAEVGYELLPDFHRNGVMSEALERVLEYGFNELNLQEIIAKTNKDNENSKNLLKKHQFIFCEGEVDKGFPDNFVFSLKNTNFKLK